MFAWDDIAVFLALFRCRTTGRAAEALSCSQPTVVRRIAALEQALQLHLFDRSAAGFEPTDAARSLFVTAEQVERAICGFTAEVSALSGTGDDEVRVTFIDHFERLLVPVLRDFRARWPAVRTQLLASDRMYDLERGEADIALRGRSHPDSDSLVVHKLPPTGWTLFASAFSDPGERPSSLEDPMTLPVALLDSSAGRLPAYRWLESLGDKGVQVIRCSNYSALKSAIASGAALSMLPCTIGCNEPDLVPCFPPPRQFDVDIFLIARRASLRRRPVRDLFDSVAAHFRDHPELMTGRPC